MLQNIFICLEKYDQTKKQTKEQTNKQTNTPLQQRLVILKWILI